MNRLLTLATVLGGAGLALLAVDPALAQAARGTPQSQSDKRIK